MSGVQFSLRRLMLGVAFTALACWAARFTWEFARWLLLPSLAVLWIAVWALLLSCKRPRITLAALTLGAAAGWLLEMFSLALADGGRGTYLPLLVFFSPLHLLAVLSNSGAVSIAIFLVAPTLYALYSAAIVGSTRCHWGPGCFITIIMFHYSLVVIASLLGTGDDLTRFRDTWSRNRLWISMAAFLFAAIHVGTVVYLITHPAKRRVHTSGRRKPILFSPLPSKTRGEGGRRGEGREY